MDDKLRILGRRIADLRAKKGLTQEKLAELVGYSTNHISKLELARTNPSFDLLVHISEALQIELKDLFNFDEYNSISFIKKELNHLILNSTDKKLKLIYKIYNSLEN